jgi:hypothetical protein
VPNVAAKQVNSLRSSEASSLLREIEQAHQSMQSCFREMEQVLARPTFDAGALTSVRLKLAGIRLTRGPLITRVADVLAGNVTQQEDAMLEELRSSHQRLLQTATAHTARWTLEAIAMNWTQYRDETRQLMRQWVRKAEREQRLVYPLVKRCAERS